MARHQTEWRFVQGELVEPGVMLRLVKRCSCPLPGKKELTTDDLLNRLLASGGPGGLLQFELECTHHAYFFYGCARRAVRSGFIISVSAEDLNIPLIGASYSADAHS